VDALLQEVQDKEEIENNLTKLEAKNGKSKYRCSE